VKLVRIPTYYSSFSGGVGGNGGVGGGQGGSGGIGAIGEGPRITYGSIHTQHFNMNLYVDSSSPEYYFSIMENLTEATPDRF
jgi:hypothetical protein